MRYWIFCLFLILCLSDSSRAQTHDLPEKITAFPEIVDGVSWDVVQALALDSVSSDDNQKYISAVGFMRVGRTLEAKKLSVTLMEVDNELLSIRAKLLRDFADLYLSDLSLQNAPLLALEESLSAAVEAELTTDWVMGRSAQVLARQTMKAIAKETAEERVELAQLVLVDLASVPDFANLAILQAQMAETHQMSSTQFDPERASYWRTRAYLSLYEAVEACGSCELERTANLYLMALGAQTEAMSRSYNEEIIMNELDRTYFFPKVDPDVPFCEGTTNMQRFGTIGTRSEIKRFGIGGIVMRLSIDEKGRFKIRDVYSAPQALGERYRPILERQVKRWRYTYTDKGATDCRRHTDSFLRTVSLSY